MNPPFSGARLKIKRANQHIDELVAVLDAFSQSDYYSLSFEDYPDSRNCDVHFEFTKPIPDILPCIIGDTIHNSRSALDLAVWEIVALAGGTPDKYTRLPFTETRQKLEDTIQRGKIKTAGAIVADFIVDTIKPYRGGNDTLFALHDLDIVDKHRLLIPVLSLAAIGGVSFFTRDGRAFENAAIDFGPCAESDSKVVRYPGKITKHGKPALLILFDKDQPFEGHSVIPTLHHISDYVSRTIDAFEAIVPTLGK